MLPTRSLLQVIGVVCERVDKHLTDCVVISFKSTNYGI